MFWFRGCPCCSHVEPFLCMIAWVYPKNLTDDCLGFLQDFNDDCLGFPQEFTDDCLVFHQDFTGDFLGFPQIFSR